MYTFNINPYAETVYGKVELYDGSTLLTTCTCEDVLQDFTVERVGVKNKFFGFGICQKISVNLIDIERVIEVKAGNAIVASLSDGTSFFKAYPTFYITEVNRDENTNTISLTAYDKLYNLNKHTFNSLGFNDGSIYSIVDSIANYIGIERTIHKISSENNNFNDNYYLAEPVPLEGAQRANLDGEESLHDVLNAIAELTQTIYYINNSNELVFRELSNSGAADFTIGREDYYILESKTNRRLSAICSATELGDNITASIDLTGTTQYLRNNPFLELRADAAELLNGAIARVGGLTINQFYMNWRGNFLLEIGDKIGIVLEDNSIVNSYMLDDVVRFMGYIDEDTQYEFEDNESETASNPSTIGEAIKQTYAKVDKVNKEIALVVSTSENNSSEIAQLKIDTNGINASVSKLEQETQTNIDGINTDVANLRNQVNLQVSPEELTIMIEKEIESKGVTEVETNTGFTFNDFGLTVTKDNSEMKTQITEDGMSVFREEKEVLTADNVGVKAENLHATTYLIIGTNSRFEDWNGRTACFWIGGN